MKKWMKRIAFGLVILFSLLQFIPRPVKNISSNRLPTHLESNHTVPPEVSKILQNSCYDCHSNHTNYPWYASIQPLSIFLNDHVIEGKKHFNADLFSSYPIRRQYHALEEILEVIESNEMPLKSYTLIHTDASLNETDKKLINGWASTLIDSFKRAYPPDSLMRRR